MSWVFGILSTLLTVSVLVLCNRVTGWSVQSLIVLFVVPAGAIASGAGCAWGMFRWLASRNQRPSPIHRAGGVALGILGFALLYFLLYLLSGSREPFGRYMVDTISDRDVVIHVVGLPRGESGRIRQREEDFVWSWICFVLEGIGFVVGAWVVAGPMKGEREFCTRCSREMRQIEFGKAPLEELSVRKSQLEAVRGDARGVRALVEREVANFQSMPEEHVELALAVCSSCRSGSVLLKHMRCTDDGLKERVRKRQSVPLGPTATSAAVAALSRPRQGG